MSLRLWVLNVVLRRVEKPRLARVSVAAARRSFEAEARLFRDPPRALYLPDRVGVPALWAETAPARSGVILYLHGGAHVMGSPRTHRAMLARLSALTGLSACLPDMRLAPEHPYPAGLDDCEAAWDALVGRGYPSERIVLGGDSAGGGLMLALLARLLARGERPRAAFAFSPWTDLTASGASLAENARADPLLPVVRMDEARGYYLGGTDPSDPGASPLFGRFPGCPPVFLQTAGTEILRDDTLRMADRLRAHGAEVELDLWPDTPHVVALFQGWLPEADEVLRRTAAFLTRHLPAPPPSGS
jgi:monoterpene epsilon-lactone hydrolase